MANSVCRVFMEEAILESFKTPVKRKNISLVKYLYKTVWEYKVKNEPQVKCTYKYYVPCNCEGFCSCTEWFDDSFYISYKTYHWEQVGEPEKLDFELTDSTSVDVFSSAAWVQTKGGNLGTNNDVKTDGTEFNNFKFSSGDILSLQMNSKNSCGSGECIKTIPLDYTPLNQNNADFMVYAGGKPENNSFTSAANWYKVIEDKDAFTSDKQKNTATDFGVMSMIEKNIHDNTQKIYLIVRPLEK